MFQALSKDPLALVGAQVIDAYSEEFKLKKLKPSKIRGIPSEGMACSEKELGLSEEHEGVLILPEDAPVGSPLSEYLGETVLHFDIKGGFSHLSVSMALPVRLLRFTVYLSRMKSFTIYQKLKILSKNRVM